LLTLKLIAHFQKEQAELRKQPNGLDNLDEWRKAGSDKMDVDENSAPELVNSED